MRAGVEDNLKSLGLEQIPLVNLRRARQWPRPLSPRATRLSPSAAAAAGQSSPSHHTTILALGALLENRQLAEVVDEARRAKRPKGICYYRLAAGGRGEAAGTQAPPPQI